MRLNAHIGMACLLIVFLSSISPNTQTDRHKKPPTKDTFDFALVKEWVKDKRIVALGESTHGIGEFFSLKAELAQYLHKELGFEVVAIEGGFGDINLAWLNRNELSSRKLRDKSLFANFRTQEIAPLFSYIKSQAKTDDPLILAGFDPQSSGTIYEGYLDTICTFLELPFDLDEEFSFYVNMYQATFEQDSTNFTAHKKRYQGTLTQLNKAIIENKEKLKTNLKISEKEIEILRKTLAMQYAAIDYFYKDRFNAEYIPAGIMLRDLVMAQNIEWIMDHLYPNKKIILWGHNAHLQSGPFNGLQTKWMGQHLEEIYGEAYFSIGLFAHKGRMYQHWTQESVDFENNDSDLIEQIMSKGSLAYAYKNFSEEHDEDWIHQTVRAFEPENNGFVSFVPSERFDAAICILEGSPPTFD